MTAVERLSGVVCCRGVHQDMALIFVTARFDESKGVWIYTLPQLAKAYSRKWFWIDLVRGCVCARIGQHRTRAAR